MIELHESEHIIDDFLFQTLSISAVELSDSRWKAGRLIHVANVVVDALKEKNP